MPIRKLGNTLKLYKGPDDITLDLPLRHYKYLNSIEMNLAAHPLHPNLKKKLIISMERAKLLRKLKIDDDTESESLQIYKPYHKIVLRHCQSISVLSNYIMNTDDITQSSSKIKDLILKLKALTKYKSFSLSSRELALAQRTLKALELVSSKFSNDGFKKAISYLLNHKSSFPLVKELYLSCRLSRDRENILDILPTILRSPKYKQIRLGLLYARELPYYYTLPMSSKSKIKELVMLMDDGYSATDTLPCILPFYNLETLTIGSPFRGFTVDIEDYKNWKALEKLSNLKNFSLEISLDSKNAKNLALLLSSLSFTKGLENLRLWFRFVPFEGLVDLYYGHLERFMRNLGNLHNLSSLSLMFESEKLRRLQEVTELLCRALKEHGKLKDVYIAFPEPRYRSVGMRHHGVLDISKILCSLKRSQKSLEKLYIGTAKAEIKELREWVRFENLKKVTIAVDEKMGENNRLDSLLVAMEEESLRKLELKMASFITSDDLETLKDFKKLENVRISVLGEKIAESVGVLREIFVQSQTVKEVWLEFPELDFREENRIEEMVLALLNKKRIKRINVKTKFMKYSFDRNLDGSMREQSSNEHRKIRLMY